MTARRPAHCAARIIARRRDLARTGSPRPTPGAAVALTIDTEVHPPKILLIRGQAELEVVDGIPDEYLQINGTYQMTARQRVEWEAEVRSLYDGMVRIIVIPTWAKLIDFDTTLPARSRSWSGNETNVSAADQVPTR